MIKTLNPSSSSSKTDEIMSRYRPIAPKPETSPANCSGTVGGAAHGSLGSPSPKINQSPYLRGIWAHLQARPTRTRRKRSARAGIFPHPPAFATAKRRRPSSCSSFLDLCTNPAAAAHQSLVSMHMQAGFAHAGLPPLTAARGAAVTVMERPVAAAASIGSHPLLSSPMPSPTVTQRPPLTELNFVKTLEAAGRDISVDQQEDHHPDIIKENDLQLELKLVPSTIAGGVISPRPMRPIGSSIRVGFINTDLLEQQLHAGLVLVEEERRRPEEVEEEMEAEELPAIISDSNNKVRMANSAYKEMVGEPECPWLDSMMSSYEGSSRRRRRISGEVVIQYASDTGLPIWAKGFSCWVMIEWESKGEKRRINAFSEATRLWCDSKDYLFRWRFHVQETEPSALELAPSTSN